MKHTSLGQIFYVKIDKKYLGPDLEGFEEGILHGIYCREGEAVLSHILLKSGAHWSGIPLVGLNINKDSMDLSILQPWGGMGDDISVSCLDYLSGLPVEPRFIPSKGRHSGIIIDWNGKFSKHPTEHKPLSLIVLDSGGFCLLPNNYFIISDKHFTYPYKDKDLENYLRMDTIYYEK